MYTIEKKTLTDIADAIREKTGKSELILPGDMPGEIKNIEKKQDMTNNIFLPTFKWSIQGGNDPYLDIQYHKEPYLTKQATYGGAYCFGQIVPAFAKHIYINMEVIDGSSSYYHGIDVFANSGYAVADNGGSAGILLCCITSGSMSVAQLQAQTRISYGNGISHNLRLNKQIVTINIEDLNEFYIYIHTQNQFMRLYGISFD